MAVDVALVARRQARWVHSSHAAMVAAPVDVGVVAADVANVVGVAAGVVAGVAAAVACSSNHFLRCRCACSACPPRGRHRAALLSGIGFVNPQGTLRVRSELDLPMNS